VRAAGVRRCAAARLHAAGGARAGSIITPRSHRCRQCECSGPHKWARMRQKISARRGQGCTKRPMRVSGGGTVSSMFRYVVCGARRLRGTTVSLCASPAAGRNHASFSCLRAARGPGVMSSPAMVAMRADVAVGWLPRAARSPPQPADRRGVTSISVDNECCAPRLYLRVAAKRGLFACFTIARAALRAWGGRGTAGEMVAGGNDGVVAKRVA
jgi:hypothetical protein